MNPLAQSPIWLAVIIWSVIWKGIALWRAANSKQKNWFIVLMLPINTAGIIELVYLFKFAKKRLTLDEIRSWVQKPTK
jgi:methionyl-tRNA synthetase